MAWRGGRGIVMVVTMTTIIFQVLRSILTFDCILL